MIALCVICGRRMAGSALVNPAVIGQTGMIFAIHLIDEHWDLVERIRATSGDGEARMALNAALVRELGPVTGPRDLPTLEHLAAIERFLTDMEECWGSVGRHEGHTLSKIGRCVCCSCGFRYQGSLPTETERAEAAAAWAARVRELAP